MLAPSSEATVANGMKILRSETEMKLNGAAELKKGAHYYDIPQLRLPSL